MDIATLTLVHTGLTERGIRRAAKLAGRPSASVSAALKRMEAAIAVPLVRRESGNLVPTLEAQRRFADLAAARAAIDDLLAPAEAGRGTVPSVSINALERFLAVAHSGSIRAASPGPSVTRNPALAAASTVA